MPTLSSTAAAPTCAAAAPPCISVGATAPISTQLSDTSTLEVGAPAPDAAGVWEVFHSRVLVRTHPSTSAGTVGAKFKGQLVEAVSRDGDWVEIADGGGGTWMLTDGSGIGLGQLLVRKPGAVASTAAAAAASDPVFAALKKKAHASYTAKCFSESAEYFEESLRVLERLGLSDASIEANLYNGVAQVLHISILYSCVAQVLHMVG